MLPKMLLIRQNRPANKPVGDMRETIQKTLQNIQFDPTVLRGRKVGIAVGSRGISRMVEIVSNVVKVVRDAGGQPVIFAAMGCHGDGNAAGQREMLRSLGIYEEAVGAPVETCAETTQYGVTESGIPVYGNTLPLGYDAVILINRVKMHTDFEDVTESGLLKLLAIGVGNPTGCKNVHSNALRFGYGRVIRETAAVMLKRLPVVAGFMLTENWKHELDRVEAVLPENFVEREIDLLQAVKDQAVKLPVSKADALIIGEIGKNISGTGMDTKVVGRIRIIGQKEPETPAIGRIVVLDITEASHGNAIGIGLADYSTMAVHDKINIHATSLNAYSSMAPEQGCLPCFMLDDREALNAAVETVGLEDPSKAHVLYIQDTNSLEYLAVSEALYEDALREDPSIEKVGEPFELQFDERGSLLQRWKGKKLVNL
ncbi:hypothetical protein SAMN05216343_1306 [Oscillibacter sp. PC13]|uniref:hypothetical protein n=1 Tax=Oscillibacter sp. PC13 TaxID=1855299 RepID=UPI0008F32102|nr:hypothetical protein [Oscillibacter sp. PC13]SFQ18577.1 hypothetical protein SAMN05216343_1306 [Oscillibacter sp. PC13]